MTNFMKRGGRRRKLYLRNSGFRLEQVISSPPLHTFSASFIPRFRINIFIIHFCRGDGSCVFRARRGGRGQFYDFFVKTAAPSFDNVYEYGCNFFKSIGKIMNGEYWRGDENCFWGGKK